MCAICRRYICPSACPSFLGESAELGKRLFECSACGEAIYEGDEYIVGYGKPYCNRCVSYGAIENEAQEGQRGGGKRWMKR